MTTFTDKPWDGDAARFKDADEYCNSALIDENPDGKDKVKSLCHLPVREPGTQTVNKNALGPAAAALAGARGGLDAQPASKKSAARALVRLYREAQMPPPPGLLKLAQ